MPRRMPTWSTDTDLPPRVAQRGPARRGARVARGLSSVVQPLSPAQACPHHDEETGRCMHAENPTIRAHRPESLHRKQLQSKL